MVKRTLALAAVATAVLLLGACSSGRAQEVQEIVPPAAEGVAGDSPGGQIESSPEFQAAWQRVKRCMQLRGYSGFQEAGNVVTRLKDGSIFEPQSGEAMTGPAVTEYFLDQATCYEESGFAEFVPVPDFPVESIERMNRSRREFYSCMAAAGWSIPEPTVNRGWVIYYPNERTAREDTAWNDDAAHCGTTE